MFTTVVDHSHGKYHDLSILVDIFETERALTTRPIGGSLC